MYSKVKKKKGLRRTDFIKFGSSTEASPKNFDSNIFPPSTHEIKNCACDVYYFNLITETKIKHYFRLFA